MIHRSVLLVLVCSTFPAFAAEPHLTGMAEEVLASEWADPVNVDDSLFNPLSFDHPSVETVFLLDGTPLALVWASFGGTAQSEEIFEGTPFTWLCYDTGAARTTFAAVRIAAGGEAEEAGPVLGVVVEETGAPTAMGCSTNEAAASPLPGNDIPGLGATLAELAARFGSAPADGGGHLAYVSHAQMGDEESWTESKTIYYRVEDGIVTGVAYRLSTER